MTSLLLGVLLGGCQLFTNDESELGDDKPPRPAAGEVVELASASEWRLVVTKDQELNVLSENGRRGAGGYTQPPTLDEAAAHLLLRDGQPVTVIAGPVTDAASRVLVRTVEGVQREAPVIEAFGMSWFWTEFPGEVRPAELVAIDADEDVVDESTQPPMPGPSPNAPDVSGG